MSGSDFDSGPWTGFYNYKAGGARHRMDLTLLFVRGIVSGQGNDRVGLFGIAGCYDSDNAEILWSKTYFGAHCVHYRGFVDGCSIWGTWEIKGQARGGFRIWPVGFEPRQREEQNTKTQPLELPARKVRP